jgi:hypothetical protein
MLKQFFLPFLGLLTLSTFWQTSLAQAPQPSEGQQIEALKNVVPPSPNASSLGKYGEWPVSLYTGLPNISVPITTLKGRTIAVPISLSYHAAGNRVGETPSWVGLGWTLQAGGAVTRSIKGLPDEFGYFTNAANSTNPNDYSSQPISDLEWINTVVGASKGELDTQQDIYNLNALGKSYRIILKADGSMQTMPVSSIKLLANPIVGPNKTTNTWIFLLEDGTKLILGGDNFEEKTHNRRVERTDLPDLYFTSSWMLQSMTSTSNELISFTYTFGTIKQDAFYSESDFLSYIMSFTLPPNPGLYSCGPEVRSGYRTNIDRQTVVSIYPSTIESENERIDFVLSATERLDLPGSKALSEIKVFSKKGNNYTEKYVFNTVYSTALQGNVITAPDITNDPYHNYRLKLNSFERVDPINTTATKQKWSFDYNPQILPSRRSLAQDHWGFFNGSLLNNTLLPEIHFILPVAYNTIGLNYTRPANYGFMPAWTTIGGNREPNANFIEAEMLTKINFPTGGSSSFTYEPNSIPVTEETFNTQNLSISLNQNLGQNPQTNTATTTFTITKPQYIHLASTSHISQGILNDRPGAITKTEVFNSSETQICGFVNTDSKWFNLIQPGTYTIKISSNVNTSEILTASDHIIINTTLKYKISNGQQNFNKMVGGLRIKKIVDNDGSNSNALNEKSFIYENPLVINPVNLNLDYLTIQEKIKIDSTIHSPPLKSCTYHTATRNTSSKFALGSIQGGTIGYGKVTTLYGANGINGKTVSIFSTEGDDYYELRDAKLFPYPSVDSRDHRRGLLLEETHYKSDLTTIVKKTTNAYSFNLLGYTKGLKAGYSTIYETYTPYSCMSGVPFSCGITTAFQTTSSEQVKTLSTTETIYDQNGQNPFSTVTNFFYDNPINYAPIRTETTDSKGNTIRKITRTALEKTDINILTPLSTTAAAALDAMVAKNMISQPVQAVEYLISPTNQSTRTQVSLTNFKSWPNNLVLPESIQMAKGQAPLTTNFTFQQYDNKGNILQGTAENGMTTCFIWGYNQQYPLAKVTGTITYNDLITLSGINLGLLNDLNTPESAIQTELNKLRNNVGITNNRNLLVTTYTYKAMVGISTETDPNGKTIYYEYDEFNRLKFIKDHLGSIIKSYQYNYKQ